MSQSQWFEYVYQADLSLTRGFRNLLKKSAQCKQASGLGYSGIRQNESVWKDSRPSGEEFPGLGDLLDMGRTH